MPGTAISTIASPGGNPAPASTTWPFFGSDAMKRNWTGWPLVAPAAMRSTRAVCQKPFSARLRFRELRQAGIGLHRDDAARGAD
jgi:hypothetical protein